MRKNAFATASVIALVSDLARELGAVKTYAGFTTAIETHGFDAVMPRFVAGLMRKVARLEARIAELEATNAAMGATVAAWDDDDMAVSTATVVERVERRPVTANVRKRLEDVAHRQGWIPASVIDAIETLPARDQYAGTGAVFNIDRGLPLGDRQAAIWNDHIAERIVVVA